MALTKQEVLEKLFDIYSHHYDVDREGKDGGGYFPATATYFLRDENYLISKKHVLNAVENYEYMYFCLADHVDEALLKEQIEKSMELGKQRVKPHKEHMSSFITLVVIADTITPEAKKFLKRTHMRKYFWLALHGWMEYHIAAMELSTMTFLSNPAGRDVKKALEQNFGSKAKKKGEYNK